MSPSSGIRAGFLECGDRVPTVRQFAPGLCGCGFESRRFRAINLEEVRALQMQVQALQEEIRRGLNVATGDESEEENEEEEIG